MIVKLGIEIHLSRTAGILLDRLRRDIDRLSNAAYEGRSNIAELYENKPEWAILAVREGNVAGFCNFLLAPEYSLLLPINHLNL